MSIVTQQWSESIVPLVSICCLTYNHEKYIEEAIEGFLIQNTDFRVEILIHDDCSSDKTAEIIRKYEEDYPELIFPVYQRENQFSKGIKPLPTFIYPKVKGKYIALCEGDDYWTDPLKLQKQINFLEADQVYGLIHSDCNIINSNNVVINHQINQKVTNNRNIRDKETLINELLDNKTILRTASVVFRSDLIKNGLLDSNFMTLSNRFNRGDIVLWMNLAKITSFAYIDEPMINYRITNSSASRPGTFEKRLLFMLKGFEFRLFYLKENNIRNIVLYQDVKRKYDNMLIKLRLFAPNTEAMFEIEKKQPFINLTLLFLSNFVISRYITRKFYTYFSLLKH